MGSGSFLLSPTNYLKGYARKCVPLFFVLYACHAYSFLFFFLRVFCVSLTTMITMKEIYKDLINEASNTYTWLDNISDECKEFLSQLSIHIRTGNKANATKLQEILEREFEVRISHSTANRWIRQQYKESSIND